jgi:Arf-GAP/coiled-coil/ANK repeat/PH domain-containing protein
VDNSSDSSEPESISEAEVDVEVRSTTSFEDISSLTANMLLYKAARARNIYVMMDALAQSAQVNWANEDDNGRTPLIQGILSVSNHVPVITDATVCI